MTTVGVFAAILNERGEILCVQRNYPPFGWTVPGGMLEDGESPEAGVVREVFEETGYHVEVERLIGVYSAPFKSDLVLSFACRILRQNPWLPSKEISAIDFFPVTGLPQPMRNNARVRIMDAFNKRTGVWRVFSRDEHA